MASFPGMGNTTLMSSSPDSKHVRIHPSVFQRIGQLPRRLGVNSRQRLSRDQAVAESNMHFQASCLVVRRSSQFGQAGNPAVVDLRQDA
jgi:hypothetical protein